MIARPVASALECGSCRNVMLKAVLLRPVPSLGRLARRAIRQPSRCPPNSLFSTARSLRSTGPSREDEETVDDEDDDSYKGTPWFLEIEPPRHPPTEHAVPLPKAPEDAPSFLQPMMQYIYEDMGLDDLSLLDLRDLDPPPALGPHLIMLLGTARSERHLHVCSHRFVRWLKRNHKVNAQADGLIGPGELKTKLKRLRKKAKLLGTNSAILPGGDNGISTGWVCVNFATSEGGLSETASFDEGGRFSGFGAPQTGTTIVVQVMTEARRSELDLETLWRGILRRNLEEMQRIRGRAVADAAEVESLLSSKIQLPSTGSAQQWEAMKRASQQQRYFSTTARRLGAQDGSAESTIHGGVSDAAAAAAAAVADPGHSEPNLAVLSQQVSDLQITGTSVSTDILKALVSAVLQVPPSVDNDAASVDASARLALVDQLCQLADERGMDVLSADWLAALIESIVLSPAYGPELQRAQRNLEFVLAEKQISLSSDQALALMAAHAHRQDWDRFWDVFRIPPRFQQARSRDMYELAFRAMAATGSRRLCIDALRWVYPEMLREQPPVWPFGSLYAALKACILVADPAAEQLLHNPPVEETGTLAQRRWKNREFLRVLREVETLRNHHASSVASEQRVQALSQYS